MKYDLITILGPTASGKTHLAVNLAYSIGGEIISGDSRQVYRGMDIGTGKDLSEYVVNGRKIPYHLIDIVDAGYKYNIYEYQRDFINAYESIVKKDIPCILCGGSGLYVESVLRGYKLLPVPQNAVLREELSGKNLAELTDILKTYKVLHNTTETDTAQRAVRAIEIEEYYKIHKGESAGFPEIKSIIFGINPEREVRRARITARLKARLDEGLVEEIKGLIDNGIPVEDLIYYGLEYKYVSLYVSGKISYNDMFSRLEIAIHQFAKRQMTWFRGMERRGLKINWIVPKMTTEEGVKYIKNLVI